MQKKLVSILVVAIVIMFFGTNRCMAAENTVSNFIPDIYTGSANVLDANGNDVTRLFLKAFPDVSLAEYDSVMDWTAETGCCLHKQVVTTNPGLFGLLANRQQYRNCNDFFDFRLSGKDGIGQTDVRTELYGGYWFDPVNEIVIRVTNPTYRVTHMQNDSVAVVTANNFSTGSYVNNGIGYFWGDCHFAASIRDNTSAYDIDLGSHRVSFDTKHAYNGALKFPGGRY